MKKNTSLFDFHEKNVTLLYKRCSRPSGLLTPSGACLRGRDEADTGQDPVQKLLTHYFSASFRGSCRGFVASAHLPFHLMSLPPPATLGQCCCFLFHQSTLGKVPAHREDLADVCPWHPTILRTSLSPLTFHSPSCPKY